MTPSRWRILPVAAVLLAGAPSAAAAEVSLRAEYALTLAELTASLERLQLGPEAGADAGALSCPHCHVRHTRAAEAVWPMAWQYTATGEARHLRALRALAAWLFRQQQPDGSWKETPEEWTGTTTDQLLMLVLAFREVSAQFDEPERQAWRQAIAGAADYLARVMSPEFASINYVATTAASLAAAHTLVPKPAYLDQARALARQTVALLDEDGFLDGEGGKCHDRKMGVDLGYALEMSFWGLGYYARLTGDRLVDDLVRSALRRHLPFIYPNGIMDGSWGIRSNKWTTYGSATSDGCQVLFALYADVDPAYATAGWRNLQYLRTCLRDGLVTYGPHHAAVLGQPPCIYPTFAKAKNLALALQLDPRPTRPLAPLPADRPGWQQHFPTLDLAVTRTRSFMATVTAYGYQDIAKGADSKYMFRPTGGALSCLWVEGIGLFQASSQTEYHRWEPMHFPPAEGVRPLTPRIEFTRGPHYFTNLFEFDGRLRAESPHPGRFAVSTYGQLKDRRWHYGGVSYRLTHVLEDESLTKEITLHYRGAAPEVRLVEPIIRHDGTTFRQTDRLTIEIRTARRLVRLRLAPGPASLAVGPDADKHWSPYPALQATPLVITVPAPEAGRLNQTVAFTYTLLP